jgi:WD40 repeat protein
MAFHPNKTLLATGGHQQVCIYDIQSNNQNLLMNLDTVVKNTVAIGFKDKGATMYTAGENKTIKLWDMRNIKCSSEFAHSMPITALALHPNQLDFIYGDDNGYMHRWDVRTAKADKLEMVNPSLTFS